LNGVEINSSFYRPHKRATYERWATAVSADFRFSVKVPRFAADPPRAPGDGEPGGDTRLAHFRLHGSPKIYYSDYPEATLETLAPTSA
jgi:uncharacterized protein YecE (DUF72 family)